MCLNPRKIINPTSRVSRTGGQPLYLEVPCGKCAECKDNIRLQWHFRSYQHCDDVIRRGGYVLYDTLTYRPEDVPHLSDFFDIKDTGIKDFYCFNSAHWRNFLKNLRRQIDYHYKGVNITYFLTSEYGTDDLYTHRPHYHILLFVSSPRLHPIKLSRLISKCWTYGRTDGLPYKTLKYLSENVFGFNLGFSQGENSDILKVCSYISKYITKDSKFQQEIDKRVDILKKYIDNDDDLRKLLREINMFHRQSQGFGLSYITRMDNDEYNYLFNNGACRIIDKDKVTLTLRLPLYYKRKLFYKCLKDAENRYFWQPTAKGVAYLENSLLHSVTNITNRYKTLYANLDQLDKIQVDNYLKDRTLEDFVIYKLFYKGRARTAESFNISKFYQTTDLNDTEYNLYDWMHNIISSQYVRTSSHFDYFERDRDKNIISLPVAYGNLFDDKPFNTIDYDYKAFLKQITFNENSCRAFNDFDRLNSLFDALQKPDRKLKQQTFDFLEELNKKFKVLYQK